MSHATPAPASPGADFQKMLGDLEDGRFLANCAGEVQVLVREMNGLHSAGLSKSAGKVTIELNVVNDGGIFTVTGDVKVKMPKRPRSRSVMYARRDGTLTALNPSQHELPLKSVESSPLRAV